MPIRRTNATKTEEQPIAPKKPKKTAPITLAGATKTQPIQELNSREGAILGAFRIDVGETAHVKVPHNGRVVYGPAYIVAFQD